MTITDAMVEAACEAYYEVFHNVRRTNIGTAAMRAALEAAYPQANVDLSFLGSAEADKAANETIIANLIRENEALRKERDQLKDIVHQMNFDLMDKAHDHN